MVNFKNTLFLTFIAVVTGFSAIAQRKFTREEHKAYELDSVQKIIMDCRFGSIHVVNDCVDSVRFDVLLSVNAQSEDVAEKLLDLIEIQWDSIVPVVGAKTLIDPSFRPKEGFGIDYRISVPSDRELEIKSSFCEVKIDSLKGKGKFSVEHGSFEGQYLEFPVEYPGELEVSYSKVRLNEFSEARINADFSKVFAGKGEELEIMGSYSGWGLDSVKNIHGASSNDSFRLLWVNDLKITGHKTNFNIRSIGTNIKCSNDYGTCTIDGFSDHFEQLDLSNKYGDINLNVSNLSNAYYIINTFQSNVLIPMDLEIHKDISDDRTIYQSDKKVPGAANIQIKSDYGAVELKH